MGREKSAHDLEEKTDSLIDANDLILERVNNLLDEASGKKKTDPSLIVATLNDSGAGPASRIPSKSRVATWNRKTAGVVDDATGATARGSGGSEGGVSLLAAKNVARPQLSFKDAIDNSATPFIPKLRAKPHAKTPLRASFPSSDYVDGEEATGVHPYKDEIRSLVYPTVSRMIKE